MNSHPVAPIEPLSLDEYLNYERLSAVRHEYVVGELYAFAGASRRHNRIVTNFVIDLGLVARGGPCAVYSSDVKLKATEQIIYYPDVMVVCDPEDVDELIVARPCLIVEVASPSTEMIDRREKLFVYRQIESLEHYLIVEQDQRKVFHHSRGAGGDWTRVELRDEGSLRLTCPETELSLDQIYEGID